MGPAAAQDAFIAAEPQSQYLMNLGVGGALVPQYPGADKYMFVPYPIIEFGRMYLPFIGQTEKKTRGIFIYPSLNIIGERKASDDNSLKGTKKIDWAFEAGIGGGFRYDWFRAYATIRQGFNGYSGQTGEIGADVILPIGRASRSPSGRGRAGARTATWRPISASRRRKPPRASSPPTRPTPGSRRLGLAAQINYWVDDRTRLQVRGSWNRLIGDAGDSPIVKYGSRDQWMVGLGISRKFSFDVFR